jgi:hypothetical protein
VGSGEVGSRRLSGVVVVVVVVVVIISCQVTMMPWSPSSELDSMGLAKLGTSCVIG